MMVWGVPRDIKTSRWHGEVLARTYPTATASQVI